MCRRNPDRARSDEPMPEPMVEPMVEPGADRPRASAGCRCSCSKFSGPPPDGRRRVGVNGRRGWERPTRQPPVGELGPDRRSHRPPPPRTAPYCTVLHRTAPYRTVPHRKNPQESAEFLKEPTHTERRLVQ